MRYTSVIKNTVKESIGIIGSDRPAGTPTDFYKGTASKKFTKIDAKREGDLQKNAQPISMEGGCVTPNIADAPSPVENSTRGVAVGEGGKFPRKTLRKIVHEAVKKQNTEGGNQNTDQDQDQGQDINQDKPKPSLTFSSPESQSPLGKYNTKVVGPYCDSAGNDPTLPKNDINKQQNISSTGNDPTLPKGDINKKQNISSTGGGIPIPKDVTEPKQVFDSTGKQLSQASAVSGVVGPGMNAAIALPLAGAAYYAKGDGPKKTNSSAVPGSVPSSKAETKAWGSGSKDLGTWAPDWLNNIAKFKPAQVGDPETNASTERLPHPALPGGTPQNTSDDLSSKTATASKTSNTPAANIINSLHTSSSEEDAKEKANSPRTFRDGLNRLFGNVPGSKDSVQKPDTSSDLWNAIKTTGLGATLGVLGVGSLAVLRKLLGGGSGGGSGGGVGGVGDGAAGFSSPRQSDLAGIPGKKILNRSRGQFPMQSTVESVSPKRTLKIIREVVKEKQEKEALPKKELGDEEEVKLSKKKTVIEIDPELKKDPKSIDTQ